MVPSEIEQVSVAPELEQIAQPTQVKKISDSTVKDVTDKGDKQGKSIVKIFLISVFIFEAYTGCFKAGLEECAVHGFGYIRPNLF